MYINTHTYYSLRYGSISPEALLQLAKKNGVQRFALTDINNTSACLEVVRLAKKYDIKPILGVDFRNGVQQEFVILAKNNNGFLNINNYLSGLLHESTFKIPVQAPFLDDTFVIYPFGKQIRFELQKHEFLGISPFQ